MNDKLKRVITLAADMNEEFSNKIKESIAKNKNPEYYTTERRAANLK